MTNKLPAIVGGLLLAILMASMDNTIVSTAMGTIVGEMGGLDKFVWVTTAYMVAEMACMPIFGKLSDMYGRKRFFVFGIIMFMIGSALCGFAQSIVELSIFRAVQGVGAGAMVSIAFTILFDVVSPKDRGKMMGAFGAVFGLSSVVGPLLGGYITDHINWHWIFYINLPLGCIALLMIVLFYKESAAHSRQQIDWAGSILLVGAVICFIFALELGGKTYAWDSPQILGLFAGFVVLAFLLVVVEKRASEPIISFGLFRSRLYTTSNLVAMLSGAAYMTAAIFIPIYVQGVFGGSASNSGLTLLPMMFGSVITATLGGFLMTKLQYRTIMIGTLATLLTGLALLSQITVESSRLSITGIMVLIGLGIGASFSVLSTSVLHSFPPAQRGAANSTLNFNRSLGMALGITIFGIIQSHSMLSKLTESLGKGDIAVPADLNLSDPHSLLNPAFRQSIDPQLLDTVTAGLSGSIEATFAWSLIPAVLALMAAFLMTKDKMEPVVEGEEVATAH
ncbi:EmrB/QacA subfamily drug resistance transporter [Paenibacillus cellulosilyticus]|uniref:EmrB/QacA subfamily drug resistance transporter n=1 Tax=Paenibacillus cellulosilyticus TaxID=375489 RepID=A0A2V2Z1S1_9BACL|nr:MDR family MFS transporter [Paenibacillus cellulosilyticus]PWW02435.1 EmrB/QacA subfamily drug resistance transporter [Paenibacillus cellulosilyticus]QKS47146.1 MFS transporter [Paenibacillus cellulosilyticus]